MGPDSPRKVIYMVKQGPITGYFHSRQCYETQLPKLEDAKAVADQLSKPDNDVLSMK